jgi:hypothetical protein
MGTVASPSEQGSATDKPELPASYWEVGGPWERSDREPAREKPPDETTVPSRATEANVPVDAMLAALRTEINDGAERISREIGHLRYQLAGVLKDAAGLTSEHQLFRQQLAAQQREMVDKIVAPVLAERDATMGRLHAEHDRLGTQLAAVLRAEIVGMTETQALFKEDVTGEIAGLADAQEVVRQSLVGEIAKHTEAQTLFEQALNDALAQHAEAQKLAQQGLVNQMTKHAEALKLAELSLVKQVAALADAQSLFEQVVTEEISKQTDAHKRLEQSLAERIAVLTDEQAQFQQALQGRQNDLVDKVVAAALAQRDVTVGRVGEENEGLRRQLRGDLREEVSQIEQRLISQESELVEGIVGSARAEQEAALRQLRDEARSLREELTSLVRNELSGLVRAEVAKLADGQERLADRQQNLADLQAEGAAQVESAMATDLDTTLRSLWDETQQLRDQIGGSLLDRIETVADEQRQFRTRIATAAGVAESRFAAFSQAMSDRLDRLDQSGQPAPASAAPDPRFDEVARAVAGIVDQQQRTDAVLAEIQEQLVRLEQQRATGPVQLDDSQFAALRKAVVPRPVEEPKAPPRPARKPAAAKKRTRPPSS